MQLINFNIARHVLVAYVGTCLGAGNGDSFVVLCRYDV